MAPPNSSVLLSVPGSSRGPIGSSKIPGNNNASQSTTSFVPSNTNLHTLKHLTESSRQIAHLRQSLSLLSSTRINATTTAAGLASRTSHLATLTSPASETSASLTQASANLTSILTLLRDAREKFDTVNDCEPSIERLYKGAQEVLELSRRKDHPSNTYHVPNSSTINGDDRSIIEMAQSKRNLMTGAGIAGSSMATGVGRMGGGDINNNNNNDDDTYTATATLNNMAMVGLTEQDVYAAADSMEIIRDAYSYFQARPKWKSSPSAIGGLERAHQLGVDGFCLLIQSHLTNAGPAIRIKRLTTTMNHLLRDDGSTIQTRGDSTIATNTTFGNTTLGTNLQKKNGGGALSHQTETAADTRMRLSDALQNRDLMKSVGEYEEYLPLDTRSVRELRAMYECLTGSNCFLNSSHNSGGSGPSPSDIMKRLQKYQTSASKVSRTEKIGSGFYTRLTKEPLHTYYKHLDAYSEARRKVAFQSMQQYYRTLKAQRKKDFDLKQGARSRGEHLGSTIESSDMDAAARDAVRCLEHAMVIVAGEKSIYRCVISPTSSHTHDTSKIPLEYKFALIASYSHVCACVVDRVLDIIELFFVKDAGINNKSSTPSVSTGGGGTSASSLGGSGITGNNASGGGGMNGIGAGGAVSAKTLAIPSASLEENDSTNDESTVSNVPTVRFSASAAAASLRILDGVRMLGPSLAKLCEMASSSDRRGSMNLRPSTSASVSSNKDLSASSLASNLCICIHRSTVKSCAKALENLASAVKHNPLDGKENRPIDARVAAVSSDVVRAVRLVSPFVNAYRSVTKRRPLTWDQTIGEGAGEMEFFTRYLVMSLLSNLQKKAQRYTMDDKDSKANSQMKAYLFILNNTFYLNEQLGEGASENKSPPAPILRNKIDDVDGNDFKITSPWFKKSIQEMFEGSLKKYLKYWEKLKIHLVRISESELTFAKSDGKVLTLESGRILKARFSGFNGDFIKIFEMQNDITIIDPKLRKKLLFDIKSVFLPSYVEFYEKYSQYQFSKKNQEDYLKYPPKKLNSMLGNMFSSY